jgi:hypothetical protein
MALVQHTTNLAHLDTFLTGKRKGREPEKLMKSRSFPGLGVTVSVFIVGVICGWASLRLLESKSDDWLEYGYIT